MALHKHSERTVRRGCEKCGTQDVYWYHDTDDTTSSRPMAREECDRCGVRGGLVLCNKNGKLHSDTCSGRKAAAKVIPDVVIVVEDEAAKGDGGKYPTMVCDHCGEKVTVVEECFYWHLPGNVSATHHPDRSVHAVGGEERHDSWYRAGKPASLHSSATATVDPTPEAEPPKVDDAAGAALAAMIEPHLKGGLDAGKVDSMVADAIAKRSLPVQVEIKRGDEVKPVKGLTHKQLPDILTTMLSGENVLMVGPAGTGKSTIARQIAEALELPFYEIGLSVQTSEAKLMGYMQANGEYVPSLLFQAASKGGLFHFDELDNAHASILACVNSITSCVGQETNVGFPHEMVPVHPDFRVIASANTFGRGPTRSYVGRSPIDKSTLNRFAVEEIWYDEAMEDSICAATGYPAWNRVVTVVRALRANLEKSGMAEVISPRDSLGMCKQLQAGRTWEAVVANRLRRGLTDGDWQKLSNGVKVSL